MKTFTYIAAQGEITIRRIGDLPKDRSIPKGYTALKPEGPHVVVGHSETGHHHVMAASAVSAATLDRPPEGLRILRMIVESPTALTHLRSFDTHEALQHEPGLYEVRIGREFDPFAEIARRQAD